MLRPIDVQNVILKSFEVSKIQQQKVHSPEVEQQALAHLEKDKAIINQTKVQEAKEVSHNIVRDKDEHDEKQGTGQQEKKETKNHNSEQETETGNDEAKPANLRKIDIKI